MLVCPECRARYPEGTETCENDKSPLLPSEAFLDDAIVIEEGTMIGEYRVDRRLGSGTFGDVYAGEQPLIGKKVAIKLLNVKYASQPQVVSRFIAEARAVNRIRHRNIIDIFSFGVYADRRPYFVMELLDGITLSELLEKEKRLSLAEAIPILRGIADALDAAHQADITHRDLKPDNVFLATQKEGGYFPKLLDFGVAKLVDDELAHKTATGVAVGTPRYMSPEQCRGKSVDHRADIYSLGVLVHEMLTGKPLFDGDSAMDVLLKHTTEPPPPMSSCNPALPVELDAPVLAMLAKRPNARPTSAGAAIAALVAKTNNATAHAATLPSDPRGAGAVSGSSSGVVSEIHVSQGSVETTNIRAKAPPAGDEDGPPKPPGYRPSHLQETLDAKDVISAPGSKAPSPSSSDPEASKRTMGDTSTSSIPVSLPGETLRSEGPKAAPAAATLDEPVESAGNKDKLIPTVPPPHPKASRPTWLYALIGVAALGAGGFALSRVGSGGGSAQQAPQAPATVSAAKGASTVKLLFNVSPADAEVFLGDKRLGSVKDPIVLPRGSEEVQVRIAKQGYKESMLWVKPDQDQIVQALTLVADAPQAPSASATVTATGSAQKPKGPHRDLER